ncbi:hypothetical protein NECAME_06904 [Necator americanus]|uniref:Uncharacterized protein n=1 Tax=Necator americanus TaxID=51031 RepID=W2TTG8_NECAM|nr:hypothetical protein NECAME_06904 [Necator americanus]ETN84342.1 hypothetical protein NECAME_06904 [Necator americanus]
MNEERRVDGRQSGARRQTARFSWILTHCFFRQAELSLSRLEVPRSDDAIVLKHFKNSLVWKQ